MMLLVLWFLANNLSVYYLQMQEVLQVPPADNMLLEQIQQRTL